MKKISTRDYLIVYFEISTWQLVFVDKFLPIFTFCVPLFFFFAVSLQSFLLAMFFLNDTHTRKMPFFSTWNPIQLISIYIRHTSWIFVIGRSEPTKIGWLGYHSPRHRSNEIPHLPRHHDILSSRIPCRAYGGRNSIENWLDPAC